MTELVDDTRDIIKLNRDIQGATRLGKSVQNFILWVMKWGVIGAGVAALIKWVAEHWK